MAKKENIQLPKLPQPEEQPSAKRGAGIKATFMAVAKLDSGGYHVLEAELELDDPRVRMATISRLPRSQAYEAFLLRARKAILSPTMARPGQGLVTP